MSLDIDLVDTDIANIENCSIGHAINKIYFSETLKFVHACRNYNEWQKSGSSEGLKYVADTSGFDDWVYANQNLAHVSDTEYVENPEPWPTYLTLKQGTDALPKAMVDRFLAVNTRG